MISSLRGFLSTLSTAVELPSCEKQKRMLENVEIQNYGGKRVLGSPREGGIQRALRAPPRAQAAARLNFHRAVHQL